MMKVFAASLALLAQLIPLTWAESLAAEPVRLIPKVYVSPRASGSIGSYERFERSDSFGTHGLAPYRDSAQTGLHEHNQTQRLRGAVRQGLEYPAGMGLERHPHASVQRP